MGEFSEAHLGSAAAQKGSVGGRGWARVGEPEWTAQSRFEVTVRYAGLAGWVLGSGCPDMKVGGQAPGARSPALCDRPMGSRAGLSPWVPERCGTCRVPDSAGRRAGIWGRRMGTMV